MTQQILQIHSAKRALGDKQFSNCSCRSRPLKSKYHGKCEHLKIYKMQGIHCRRPVELNPLTLQNQRNHLNGRTKRIVKIEEPNKFSVYALVYACVCAHVCVCVCVCVVATIFQLCRAQL